MILDGGLATELERRGADLSDPLWSACLLIEDPAAIRQVHLDYLRAGADVITSASYQASFEGFRRRGLTEANTAELLHASVRLAEEAREIFLKEPAARARIRPLVAASIGPYGATLADGSEFRGDYGMSVEELVDWHRPRFEALAGSGADFLACETVPCLEEVEALARLAAEFPSVKAWISCSARDAESLCHGEPVGEAAAAADRAPNVLAFGINCTAPSFVAGLLTRARASTTKPLVAYPNSGEEWDAASRSWRSGARPFDWSRALVEWRNAGAEYVGGCCRTTPDTIRSLRAQLSTSR